MGFISSEINKEHDKYILLGDIIRLVRILEGGTCSLREIATFLLKKYEDNCFDDNCFDYVDKLAFRMRAGRYMPIDETRYLYKFLCLVFRYDRLDYFDSVKEPLIAKEYQKYRYICLEKAKVVNFLQNICVLPCLPVGADKTSRVSQAKIKREVPDSFEQINDRTTFLNLIYVMKETLIDKGIFPNQAAVIEYIVNEFDEPGLSESNLKAKFAEANRRHTIKG
jgi:hypothetical protein